MSIGAALGIATSGLANINRQLALLSHNVANAGTDGYVRARGTQTAVSAGGLGLGVRTGVTVRDVEKMLRGELTAQGARADGAATREAALSAIDALHGVPGDGTDLAGLLGRLTNAFSTLAGDPANAAGQYQVLHAAEGLAQGLNALAAETLRQRQAAQDGLVADVAALNDGLARVGDLSNRIMALKAAGQGTADLENERDQAISGLAALTPVKVLEQENGDVLLVGAGGLSLPVHGAAAPFSIAGATTGASSYYPGGGLPGVLMGGVDVTAQMQGGRIGAHIGLRDADLPGFMAELDEFAYTLASRFDAQGLTLFTDPAGAVPAGGGVPVQAGYVGFSLTIQVSAAVRAAPVLVRDGTHAVVGSPTGASAFTPNPSGGPEGFTGLIRRVLDFALGAETQAGVAQVAPNVAGLGPGGTLAAPFAAPATLAELARDTVTAQVGAAATAAQRADLELSVQTTLKARYADATGVDTDAEMALMVQLQAAYGANARIIAATQSMFDTLLDMVR